MKILYFLLILSAISVKIHTERRMFSAPTYTRRVATFRRPVSYSRVHIHHPYHYHQPIVVAPTPIIGYGLGYGYGYNYGYYGGYGMNAFYGVVILCILLLMVGILLCVLCNPATETEYYEPYEEEIVEEVIIEEYDPYYPNYRVRRY
jgi:hypothetical protein